MMKLNHLCSTIPSMLNVLFPFLPMLVEIEIDFEIASKENQLNLGSIQVWDESIWIRYDLSVNLN